MRGNLLLIVLSLAVITVIVTLNLFFLQSYEAEMARQFGDQQLLLAHNISRHMQGSISRLKRGASALAALIEEGSHGPESLGTIAESVLPALWDEGGVSLRVFDATNTRVYGTATAGGQRIGGDFALRTREEGAGTVLWDASQGKLAVGAAITLGKLKGGLVVLDADMAYLIEKFLKPIQSGEKGHAWMMDSDGTLLYHPARRDMQGKNLFKADKSCFECHKSFETEKKVLKSGPEGVRAYIAPFGEDKIMAFSRVQVSPDLYWIACVSIPYSEVTASLRKSMGIHSALIIAILAATALGAVSIVVINRRRMQAEASAARQEQLKRYASELEQAVHRKTLELKGEKDKLEAIVSALDAGIFLAGKGGRVSWGNWTLLNWLGERDIADVTLSDIFGADANKIDISGDAEHSEVSVAAVGPRTGHFRVRATQLVAPDGEKQTLGLIHDITELKEFEEKMAQSEKLASIGGLTAGLAHEIGNPLTSVFSFLQILRERETDDFAIESLDTVLFHVKRMAEILKQLSGLAKIQAPELKEAQVNDAIELALGLIQFDKRAKGVQVKRQLDPDLPLVVTDANQLSQVFVNIVLNAIDAMPEGGTLTVGSKLNKDGDVTVVFEDTGVGIPQADLQKVFDPFFTTKDKGTGLGLSVSYGIVKRLGGDITVGGRNHEPGTRFTITIPAGGGGDSSG